MIHPSYVELMKVVNDEVEIAGSKQPLFDCDRDREARASDYCRRRTDGR